MELTNKNDYENFNFSGGVKAWLIICIVTTAITSLMNISIFAIKHNFLMLALTIAGLLGAFAYLQLLRKKAKIAFFGNLIIAFIIFVINILLGFGFFTVIGLLNPLITYLAIRKDWGRLS